jgi:ubiquinone/menaquinone biosynthesis C-methylase UbiE
MSLSLSTSERFLQKFHDANAGVTSRVFGCLAVDKGGELFKSSYDCLANAVPADGADNTVLDIACGDGFLLSLLAGRGQPGLSLVGVDISPGELQAARSRLGDREAALYQSRAQSLPLAANSVDYALCHMAFMLLEDVESALSEIRRVLKTGSLFCAVVGATPPPSTVRQLFTSLLSHYPRREEFLEVRFGDRRVRTREGISELFSASFENLRIEDIFIQRRHTPEALWAWFSDMYDLHMLSTDDRGQMQARFIASAEPCCEQDGCVEHREHLRLISARAI